MTTDFRALCAELTAWAEKTSAHYFQPPDVLLRARAALSVEPAVPEVVGSKWQPCVKLPITVHVREQRPGEQHVSTREGITPVQPDDLIMLGVDGEEYPIGRELFQRTYRMGSADEPAAVTGQPRPTEDDVEDAAQCIYEAMRFERVETTPAWSELGNSLAQDTARKAARAVLAHWGNPAPTPPADGEVAELVAWLRSTGEGQPCLSDEGYARLTRAAELLERQVLVPVPVGVRPWEREGWCDPNGLCWLGSNALDGCTPTWFYGPPAWAERFPNFYRVLLPAHALPQPEVRE